VLPHNYGDNARNRTIARLIALDNSDCDTLRPSVVYAWVMEPTEETPSASEENKRRFREALDRKQGKETSRPGHLDAESAIHGTQDRADHKRDFRRKTG